MLGNLTKLYNTLMQVETKGTNTLLLADCLRFLDKLISEESTREAETSTGGQENA